MGKKELPPGVLGYKEKCYRATNALGDVWWEKIKISILDPSVPPEDPPPDSKLLTPEEYQKIKDKLSEQIKQAAEEFEAAGSPWNGSPPFNEGVDEENKDEIV